MVTAYWSDWSAFMVGFTNLYLSVRLEASWKIHSGNAMLIMTLDMPNRKAMLSDNLGLSRAWRSGGSKTCKTTIR